MVPIISAFFEFSVHCSVTTSR